MSSPGGNAAIAGLYESTVLLAPPALWAACGRNGDVLTPRSGSEEGGQQTS